MGLVVGLLALGLGWVAYQWLHGQLSNPSETAFPVPEQDAVALALRAGKPTDVESGANSCAACREMKPVLAALAREHGERITVANIDIVKEREYIRRYQIRLMPTQVFYDAQGQEIGRNMGGDGSRGAARRGGRAMMGVEGLLAARLGLLMGALLVGMPGYQVDALLPVSCY